MSQAPFSATHSHKDGCCYSPQPFAVYNAVYNYYPRMRVGNVFSRVCVSVCLSVRLSMCISVHAINFEPLHIITCNHRQIGVNIIALMNRL